MAKLFFCGSHKIFGLHPSIGSRKTFSLCRFVKQKNPRKLKLAAIGNLKETIIFQRSLLCLKSLYNISSQYLLT